jgi:uncharacterized phiE125 gp8 family phage protein
MPLTLLTPPVSEPLTLAEIKLWLRIDGAAEDALVTSLLATARATIERETRRCLMPQAWRLTLDCWPAEGIIALPLHPVQSVTAIRVLTGEGYVIVPPGSYRADLARETPRIWLTGMVPQPGVGGVGIEIDFACGYATVAAVPEPLKHAIRMLTARLYENRGDGAGDIAALPADVAPLVAPFRRPRLK